MRRTFGLVGLSLMAMISLSRCAAAADPISDGQKIYQEMCAVCHGAKGEGTADEHPQPLVGDRSLADLAKFIDKEMPKDSPEEVDAKQAASVAKYIYEAFYSKAAQARAKPPRIELSRLTVRQYRETVADLIGGFRSPGRWGDQRGLRGDYYKSRRMRDNDLALERTDPTIDFDFKEGSPDPAKMDGGEFSIRWNGSVLAPDTGEYEFILRTEHAARLWINDVNFNRPLIDALVRSGDDQERRATIFLIGGRAYPLRLEFSKAKQGVDDSKKKKDKPIVKAFVALLWKPPRGTAEPIPPRNLTPNRFPEAFVLATPFPPDDRSVGYERGTTISKTWDQATTDAAIETVGYIVARLPELAGVRPDSADRKTKLREFCVRLAERAFRRPLTDEQKKLYIDRHFENSPDADAAVKRIVLLVLKSPRFLYREAGADNDDYVVAARLSFGLWDSLPDQQLLDAAKASQLATREQVAKQAERMLGDMRARAKLRTFLHQWVRLDQMPELSKDPKHFPGFDEAIAADLRTSLDLFLEEAVAGEKADFRQLLLADYVYLNGRLAKFYGVDLPADAAFQKVKLDAGERAGVLSHPFLLSGFAYRQASSPIHRGVFIARGLLGRSLRPPPEAVAPLAVDLHPGLTTRERTALQTEGKTCMSCHSLVNPLGFALERFDAVGRYRKEEQGKPIDATGMYQTLTGDTAKFDGAQELAKYLANSEETQSAFVTQLFHSLVKQPVRAYGPETLADLRKSLAKNDFNIRKLVVEIMVRSALQSRS